jgi:UDP-2-acetamido-3-amino-2,3-dideoxy-glucuronate N-acetyltransferase
MEGVMLDAGFQMNSAVGRTEGLAVPRVAVVGCGYWGKNLVRNYHAIGALSAVCDADLARAESYGREYDVPALVFDAILGLTEIDAVVIAAPAEQHARLAVRALEADKHVFVEKPLALTVEAGEAVRASAESADRVLMVGHLLHYHPAFLKLREIVAEGRLGRLQYVYSTRLNLGKFRREENVFWSFAPHDISMILALAGELPEHVDAIGSCYLHKSIADVTTTHLSFPSGLDAHVFVSWLHPVKEQKLIVVGDAGMAVFDDAQPWEGKLILFSHRVGWRNGCPEPARAQGEPVALAEAEPLQLECRHFLESIQSGAVPRTDGSEGLAVLRVLEAAERARCTGNRVALPGRLNPNSGFGSDRHVEKPPESWWNHRFPSLPVTSADWTPLDLLHAAESSAGGAVDPRPWPRPNGTSAPKAEGPEVIVHQSAYVDHGCTIGAGTRVWHFSHILKGCRIGRDCVIGQNVMIGPDVVIGDRCKIQNNVSLYKGVTLEEGVFCGPSSVFTNVLTPRATIERKDEFRPTHVRRGVTIGANATILCGITLGAYSFVAAGAVVTRDVPPHAVVAGVPARQIGWVSHAGERLGPDLVCRRTGRRYEECDGALVVPSLGLEEKADA